MKKENKTILKMNINAKMLKNILKIQYTATEEQRITFNHEGIELDAVDPSNVYMIKQKIPMREIEEYQVFNGDKDSIELGVDITKLLTVFSGNIKKTDSIKLEYDGDSNMLITRFNNFTRNNALLSLDNIPGHPKTPDLDLPASVTVNLKEFYNFLKQANSVSDHFCIKMTKEKLFLMAIGDIDKAKLEYDKKEVKNFNSHGNFLSLFSTDIVIEIVRWLKVCYENCTLYINNENPLKIICKNTTETEILIAPRMEDGGDYSGFNNYSNDNTNNIKVEPVEPKNDIKIEPEIREPVKEENELILADKLEKIDAEIEETEKKFEEDIGVLEEDRVLDPPEEIDGWEGAIEEVEMADVADRDAKTETSKINVKPCQEKQEMEKPIVKKKKLTFADGLKDIAMLTKLQKKGMVLGV